MEEHNGVKRLAADLHQEVADYLVQVTSQRPLPRRQFRPASTSSTHCSSDPHHYRPEARLDSSACPLGVTKAKFMDPFTGLLLNT